MLRIIHGDCREELPKLEAESLDACVTDPPYELGFMGKKWDSTGVAFDVQTWREVFRVLKPGAHLVAFGGTRTYHRLVCAIEDAGFEIRDQIAWVFGSGFPKNLDVSKAIDREAGAVRPVVAEGKPVKRMIPGADQARDGWTKDNGREFVPTVTEAATEEAKEWEGWGTALKPGFEPIVLARKPLMGTVAENVVKYGCGAINIDGCRVPGAVTTNPLVRNARGFSSEGLVQGETGNGTDSAEGRWPANLIHDGSEEVLAAFPQAVGQQGDLENHSRERMSKGIYGDMKAARDFPARGDVGSAARFFYCAKASGEDRPDWNTHPTVKPTALMRYLCRLVTPKGGTILDVFGGSGSTARAAIEEGFGVVVMEKDGEYIPIIRRRCDVTPGLGL